MKTLLLTFVFAFGLAAPEAQATYYNYAKCSGYFSVYCKPCPVASFNGSASQTSPFCGWGFKSLTNYAYYYYNCYFWTAYDAYNGYYGCYYFRKPWRVKSWLRTKMTNEWRRSSN